VASFGCPSNRLHKDAPAETHWIPLIALPLALPLLLPAVLDPLTDHSLGSRSEPDRWLVRSGTAPDGRTSRTFERRAFKWTWILCAIGWVKCTSSRQIIHIRVHDRSSWFHRSGFKFLFLSHIFRSREK
jgi:hypothetical protein